MEPEDRVYGWVCYIVRCRDGTLYTGITNDLARRLEAHDEGVGAKYTRTRRPVTLVYAVSCKDRREASRREHAIKKLRRRDKLALATEWQRRHTGSRPPGP